MSFKTKTFTTQQNSFGKENSVGMKQLKHFFVYNLKTGGISQSNHLLMTSNDYQFQDTQFTQFLMLASIKTTDKVHNFHNKISKYLPT